MKILLIGEYSRFHNSLKEGLVALGHEVVLVGSGDLFKKYPVDVDIGPKWVSTTAIGRLVRKVVYKLSGFDLALWEAGYRFWNARKQFKGFDVVQLINSWSIRTTIAKEKKCIDFLATHNKQMVLSACGTDTAWVAYLLSDPLEYHLLTPYLNDKSLKKQYSSVLDYLTPKCQALYQYVVDRVSHIIPTDMDYYMGLKGQEKVTSLVPTPINTSSLKVEFPQTTNPLVIFHGINRMNYLKKGNDIFEKALELLQKKYPKKVKIITVESLPYTQYMKAYEQAHILLDQVYSYDQGYNALESMARGKVVFTGAGTAFSKHYKLDVPVAVDAVPDARAIFLELEKLLHQPEVLAQISKHASRFVSQYHDHKKVAQTYVSIWQSTP
ncbi:MAG: glycosyl transferase family 1 [Cytophagaceae bacterium]|nr:glycosyl transferase family 1 [Cytophagaceae bacterium]